MNALVYWIGLLGGFLAARLMAIFFAQYIPGLVVPGWTDKPAVELAYGLFASGLFVLMLTGGLAGRFSGAGSRPRAGLAGAVAGAIASVIVFMTLVAPAAGTWGFQPIMKHGLMPGQDENQFLALLVEALVAISWWTWLALFVSLAIGFVLGGLGGLLAGSAWKNDGHLDLLGEGIAVYSMVLAGLGLVVNSATNPLLVVQMDKTIQKIALTPAYPSHWVMTFPFVLNLLFFLAAQLVYIFLLNRAARQGAGLPGSSWKMVGILSLIFPLITWVMVFWVLPAEMKLTYTLPLALLPVVGGIIFWRAWQMRSLTWEKRPFHKLVFAQWPGLIGANIALLFFSLAISTTSTALNIVLLVIPVIVVLTPGGSIDKLPAGIDSFQSLVSTNFVTAGGTYPNVALGMLLVFGLSLLLLWLFFKAKDRFFTQNPPVAKDAQ